MTVTIHIRYCQCGIQAPTDQEEGSSTAACCAVLTRCPVEVELKLLTQSNTNLEFVRREVRKLFAVIRSPTCHKTLDHLTCFKLSRQVFFWRSYPRLSCSTHSMIHAIFVPCIHKTESLAVNFTAAPPLSTQVTFLHEFARATFSGAVKTQGGV